MKILIISLLVLPILASCSKKEPPLKTSSENNSYINRIALDPFVDATSPSTLDLSQLPDIPRSVDLSNIMTSVKDQEERGTCTYFTLIGIIEAAVKKDLNKDVNFSEEYLNYASKFFPSPYSKTDASEIFFNMRIVRQFGLMLERDLSYQPTWFQKGLPCEKYTVDAEDVPESCYRHDMPDDITLKKAINPASLRFMSFKKNTNDVINVLATEKRPLIIQMMLNMKGWPKSGEVHYTEEMRKECLNKSELCGGHAIILTGYDIDKRVFFFKNSWGKEWGKNGYGTIGFDYIDRYYDGDVYLAKLIGAMNIPNDYAEDKLEVNDFVANVTAKNPTSVEVAITGNVQNRLGRSLYVSSYIMKKEKSTLLTELNDTNTAQLILHRELAKAINFPIIGTMQFFNPNKDNSLTWDSSNSLNLTFSEEMLRTDSYTNLLTSEKEEAIIRTTIYVNSDDEGLKILKRIYQPLNVN